MSAPIITIAGHLTDRILCKEDGSSITLPPFYPTLYHFRMKLVERDSQGTTRLVYPNVTDLSVSVGLVYAEPRAGSFKLRYGTGPASAAILFNENAADFKTKLGALALSTTYGLAEVYQANPSTWMCKFASAVLNPLQIASGAGANELEPETFVRVTDTLQNGEIWNEVRLIQGPVASNSLFGHILADPPTRRRIRAGYSVEEGLTFLLVNEVQAVTVPSEFTGTYAISFQGKQTKLLSATDGPTTIQNALNIMYGDGATRFSVTNPELNNAYIEFVGPFSGLPMELVEIIIGSVGVSELDFDLQMNTAEVAEAIRRSPNVESIMEAKIHVTDPSIPLDAGKDIVLFQAPVTIQRPVQWDGLAAAAPIDWLRPPNPTDYVPFDINQVITGNQSYSTSFGDGTSTTYAIAHGLNSDALSVEVRQNAANGLKLLDTDYTVHFSNPNSLTITLPSAPAANTLLVSIFATGNVSAFINHTHPIAHIINLQTSLDSINAKLAELQALLPSQLPASPSPVINPFGTPGGTADILNFDLNPKPGLVPVTRLPTGLNLTGLKSTDPKMPRPGLLLPSIEYGLAAGPGTGVFTADATTNLITIATHGLAAGRRVHITPPVFALEGTCTTDFANNLIIRAAHGLSNGRRVKFVSTLTWPLGIYSGTVYYVINTTTNNFQISTTSGGPVVDFTSAETGTLSVYSIPDLPGGLDENTDYFVITPLTNTFGVALTIGGPAIDITSNGIGVFAMTTITDAAAILPVADTSNAGKAYNVRFDTLLIGGTGIRQSTVHPGDIIGSDGRIWYKLIRSDGYNSFYPAVMDQELFRFAINETMLKVDSTLTVTFELDLVMFKQTSNVEYVLVVEFAETPAETTPSPLGPNLEDVIWDLDPVLQQRIVVTDTSINHSFGVQVIRRFDGLLRTNKKAYGVVLAGDNIPKGPTFAVRARLIEFDTENSIPTAVGLIYYNMDKGKVRITSGNVPALTS